ncbi:T9SS type A sorting domain-containing protein [Saprospiraceae bacterium]|nr:T9SS type A sorting domain-containing protein [Saprospiraceae bacterium]
MKYQKILIPFIALIVLSNCSVDEKSISKDKVSDAYEALQMMAQSRSYPQADISGGGYIDGYNHVKNKIKSKPLKSHSDIWESKGPMNIAGRTLCVDINPQNRNTIYAGSASGGLWRSFNRGLGVSWHKMPIGFPVLGVSSLEFAPQDSMTMYIGTGEVYNIENAGNGAAFRPTRGTYGIGILKSTDGGVTWEKSLDWSLDQERGVWEIRVARTDPNIVYAATTIGTFKSVDAGANWELVHDIPMVMDMEIHPTNPNIVYTGVGNLGSPGMGIYRTQDGGLTWEKAPEPVPQEFGGKVMLAIYDADPDILYASIGNSTNSADGFTWLCRTDNGGDDWSVVNTSDYSRFQGWFAHDVDINPTDPDDLQAIGITIWGSQNGGATLSETTIGGVAFGVPPIGEPDGAPNFTHSDHHDVLYDREDPQTVYYANDGGIYVSYDGGRTFQSINGGLCTTQFYNGMGVAQDIEDFAMGGLQDNSTVIYTGDPAWRRVIGGDGSWTAVNPNNSQNHFGSAQNLFLRKHTFNFNYRAINAPNQLDDITLFIAPYVLAPTNPDRMYAGRSRLYRSDNNGDSFTFTNNNNPINGDPIFVMDVAPTDEDVLYFATAPIENRPSMFYTPDGGTTIIDITEGLPDRFINDITVDPIDPDIAYVTMGGFGSGHVYKTIDAGINWTDITGDLPDVPTSAVIVDPLNTDQIYVGNDLGIFETSDIEDGWNDFNEGIVDAALVMDLKISTLDRLLYVATHGSGILSRDLIDDSLSSTDDQVDALIAIEAYPNPTTDKITLKLNPDFNNKKVDVSLRNSSGQKLDVQWDKVGQEEITISGLSANPSGVYYVTLQKGDRKHTVSVVLE